MNVYGKTNERDNVAVYRDCGTVPHHGRFHVVVDEQIILSTKVESVALTEFDEV
jgi:hypothetical protein